MGSLADRLNRPEIITRNTGEQPLFFQPIDHPGFVALSWRGKKTLFSAALAEEMASDLKEAIRIARRS